MPNSHGTATNYQFDVFFSYKRHALTLDWTRQVHSRFQFWLTQEIGNREASIFLDEECVETGQKWPEALSVALQRSRCLVCVFSPQYFQSSWCMAELSTFLERERIEGFSRYGLIAPMKFCDGEHFPESVRNIQWTDVSRYATTLPAFWMTERALELEERIKDLAKSVSRIISRAPAFRPNWPIVNDPVITPQPSIVLERL